MPTKARRTKAATRMSPSYPKKKTKPARAAAAGKTVNAWQDDPAPVFRVTCVRCRTSCSRR